MPHVLIIHEVADYSPWKEIFDHAAVRRQLPCPVATITLSGFEIAEDFEIAV
jgi:hypothetical protein